MLKEHHAALTKSTVTTVKAEPDKLRSITDSVIDPKAWTGLASEDPDLWLE